MRELLAQVEIGLATTAGETWAYWWLGSIVETALLLLIVKYAWTWPRVVDRSDSQPAEDVARSGTAIP